MDGGCATMEDGSGIGSQVKGGCIGLKEGAPACSMEAGDTDWEANAHMAGVHDLVHRGKPLEQLGFPEAGQICAPNAGPNIDAFMSKNHVGMNVVHDSCDDSFMESADLGLENSNLAAGIFCPSGVRANAKEKLEAVLCSKVSGIDGHEGVFDAGPHSGINQMGEDPENFADFKQKNCTPGACGYSQETFPAVNILGRASTAANQPGNVLNNVWKRPTVVVLPEFDDTSSFTIDDMSIRLDENAMATNLKKLDAALVGRLFNKRIPFFHLNAELHRRWDRFGSFRLVMISMERFVCFFDRSEARDEVLSGGPWVLAGQVLGMDRWTPSFSASSLDGYSTPIWVRLPGLPLFCWDKANIARITSPLGKPLWIDAATDQMEIGVFARVCVRVDLSQPLKPGVWVHDTVGSFFQKVEYEGLPTLCFQCGLVGHEVTDCKASKSATKPLEKGKLSSQATGHRMWADGEHMVTEQTGIVSAGCGDAVNTERSFLVQSATLKVGLDIQQPHGVLKPLSHGEEVNFRSGAFPSSIGSGGPSSNGSGGAAQGDAEPKSERGLGPQKVTDPHGNNLNAPPPSHHLHVKNSSSAKSLGSLLPSESRGVELASTHVKVATGDAIMKSDWSVDIPNLKDCLTHETLGLPAPTTRKKIVVKGWKNKVSKGYVDRMV